MKDLIVGKKYLVGGGIIREFACYAKSGRAYFHTNTGDSYDYSSKT